MGLHLQRILLSTSAPFCRLLLSLVQKAETLRFTLSCCLLTIFRQVELWQEGLFRLPVLSKKGSDRYRMDYLVDPVSVVFPVVASSAVGTPT
jgi:hypothetical protein